MSEADKACSELSLITNELRKLEQKAADNQDDLVEHLNSYLEGKVKRNDKDWIAKLDKLHSNEVKLEEKYKDARMRLIYEKQFLRETVYASKGKLAAEIAEKTSELLGGMEVNTSGSGRPPFIRRFSLRSSAAEVGDGGEAEQALWEVPAEEIEFHRSPSARLGQGSFGEVYRGALRGKEVAIKVLKQQDVSEAQLQDFKKEISTLSRLRHPHIILFMGACSAPGNLALVTELMAKGSVHDLMKREAGLAPIIRLKFCKETALALNWMHKMRPPVLHLDLKTSNLLVDDHYNIKVSDFGLAEFKDQARKSHQGSGLYMAPELLLGQAPSEKSDVYSYGITALEILTFTPPYKGRFKSLKEITEAVANDRQRPELDAKSLPGGEKIANLVKSCWQHEAEQRPSFQDIVSSNIFDNTILEMSISAENPVGTKFWKRYFKGKLSVPYEQLAEKLMQFCEVSFPPSDLRLLLLKDLLADQTNSVGVDTFGKVLDWFGPLEKGASLFNSVKEICLMPGFQGHLSSKEAEAMLQTEPKGAYLIRFSSQDPGFFAFTVTQGKELNHFRVLHRPGADFTIGQLKFDSLREIPAKAKRQLKLGNPITQSRYTRIEESVGGSASAVYQMLVN